MDFVDAERWLEWWFEENLTFSNFKDLTNAEFAAKLAKDAKDSAVEIKLLRRD